MTIAQAPTNPNLRWREFEKLELPPLLLCALEEFVAHGYDGTTVRAIAKQASLTVPSIYYHYENKQGLLVALLDVSVDDVLERASAAIQESGPGPEERLGAFVEAVVLYVAYRRDLALLDNEIRSLEPTNRVAYVKKRDNLEGWLMEIIRQGIETAAFEVAYPVEARRAILAMCRGVSAWYDASGSLAAEEVAIRYVDLALQVVGSKRPSRLPQQATRQPGS